MYSKTRFTCATMCKKRRVLHTHTDFQELEVEKMLLELCLPCGDASIFCMLPATCFFFF